MTDFAALAQSAVDYMNDNSSAVDAHSGAAYMENKILRAITGTESTGGRSLLGYAYQSELLRHVPAVNDRGEAYRFTHIIFFATDFGNRPINGLDMTGYCAALDTHVVTFADDLDVLGEMLLCAKCIGHWSDACDTALSKFIADYDAYPRNVFDENYHPILVGGLLFAKLAE